MQETLARALWLAFRLGLLNGAVYGAVISALLGWHNQLASWRASLVTLIWMGLLYGLISAGAFVAAALACRARDRLRSAPPSKAMSDPTRKSKRDAIAGLFLFSLSFWEVALLYGLSYGQTVLFTPQSARGMAAYLAVAALLIAALWGFLTWLVVRSIVWLIGLRSGRPPKGFDASLHLRRAALTFALLAVAIHLILPLIVRLGEQDVGSPSTGAPSPKGQRTAVSAVDVARVDTGIKVVVVGLDGLDPWVLQHLIDRGELPTFRALLERGSSGDLATLPDANSAVIWASIYSGQTPEHHGILDFYRIRLPLVGQGLFPVHRTYFKELAGVLDKIGLASFDFVQRSSLLRFPYWEIADHFGRSIGVVDGYLYSFPATTPETPGGYFLSYGLDSFAQLLAEHRASAEELPLRLQPVDLLPAGELPQAPDFDWQAATLLRLLAEREQPDLINLYAHEPDAVQHAHWRALEPEKFFTPPPPEGLDTSGAGSGPIGARYRSFDRFLARLETAIDEDTAVIVVSDHGHSPTLVHRLETQHRHGPPGVVLLFGGPFRRGYTLASANVYDIFPTVLHLVGLPVPGDAAGRVLEEALGSEFMTQWPIRTIPSYEGLWQASIRKVGDNRELDLIEIEKLKSMGYL